MKLLRGRFRLQLTRTPYIISSLKIISVFCIILPIFLYFQEKHEKEALIDFALGSKITDELVKPDHDTLILNGLANNYNNINVSGVQKIEHAFVVIVVTSLPESLSRRNIIRESWAGEAQEHGALVVFFSGKPSSEAMMNDLIEESNQYHDLIVDDFVESYYALAVKTLRIIKYFKFHHSKSKFLVKTDDDVFVNVPNLIQYCYAINKRFDENSAIINERTRMPVPDYFVGGVIHENRFPHTWNAFSKWYVPESIWDTVYYRALEQVKIKDTEDIKKSELLNLRSYPPYAEGNFYVLSNDAALDILNASTNLPMFHLEDVYVTGLLTTWMLNIQKENMPFISSSSNFFPQLSYYLYKVFTVPAKDIIAFHCDNHVELISTIYKDSSL